MSDSTAVCGSLGVWLIVPWLALLVSAIDRPTDATKALKR